ncbi:cyclic AMP-dependent transcription factor ATF-6 alpha-like isoform X2 [Eriocheir sinensis]|uniref:cyclic AMP-dependent transcription factor ATF-6 alpha-like isoform X2 n=1 Tax=Eriocheir sinensis TaxID=95602 RepID=UPI0021C9D5B4|nr:cyclic AMP-dependent transcription factor ATF-6 alpha-like isoform X2 [Eriocheir sinensis]
MSSVVLDLFMEDEDEEEEVEERKYLMEEEEEEMEEEDQERRGEGGGELLRGGNASRVLYEEEEEVITRGGGGRGGVRGINTITTSSFPHYTSSFSSSSCFSSWLAPPTSPLPLFSNLLQDVSESSSDDDLIHKLSNDLELPLALDDMEPVPPWPCQPGDVFQALATGNTSAMSPASSSSSSSSCNSNSFKYDGDMTAEEMLTRTLYPNLVASPGPELRGMEPESLVKEEPASPQHIVQLPPSPDDTKDIWDLLCGGDVKPNVKVLDTPPITPPQSEASPPHSPQPPSPVAMVLGQHHHPLQQHQQKPLVSSSSGSGNHLSQPIKVVTITTRNGGSGPGPTKGGRVTKTMKIQPKVMSPSSVQTPQPQVISIVNSSSVPKLTLPKTAVTRTLPAASPRVVQVKTPVSQPPASTSPITSPLPSIITAVSSPVSVTTTAPPSAPLAPLAPALTPGMKQGSIPDLKAFKRQQRMIKNRESASLSRKKKKEYLTSLEASISDLQKENQKLKEENLLLQQRLSSLETECDSLRRSAGRASNRKTTTALFALIFLFSLNLGPLSGILLGGESKLDSLKGILRGSDELKVPPSFSQRSLLWSRDDAAEDGGASSQLGTNTSHTCPMYINATESLRLETELRDWFEHKFRPSKTDRKKDDITAAAAPASPKTKEARKGLAGHTGEAVKGVTSGRTREAISEVWNALAPPHPPPAHLYHYIHPEALHVDPPARPEEQHAVLASAPRLSSFLEAIQRRDDTYYVVSFSPDHLLVPATARNDSARPRMSLLMPTPRPINESLAPPRDHVALMQIDCEVMHTRLVHVSEEFIPPHLRAGGSNASHPTSQAPPETPHPARGDSRRRSKSRPSLPTQ